MADAAQPEGATGSLVEFERTARQRAEQSADRMKRLASVATALSSALTARDVVAVIADEAKTAIEARSGGVWLLDEARTALVMVAARGHVEGMDQQISRFPMTSDSPLCAAVRDDQDIWVESWTEFGERFPGAEQRVRRYPVPRPAGFCCLPLRMEGRVLGALSFSFSEARHLHPDDRAFISLLAQHCAHGLERARLYEKALEAVRLRDDFLSVAGHELRTPLSTLQMQLSLLLEKSGKASGNASTSGVGDDMGIADGQAVLRTLQRLLKMADELLDVSRIRAGRLRLELEPVELCSLVREVSLRTAAERHAAPDHLVIEATGTIVGSWDPLRLELLVTNLVSNACKYGGGKPVHICARPHDRGAEIVVRDQGGGIAEADQKRIFERFERGTNPTGFAGLGLGLWIAREIAQAHGGEILLRSTIDEGSEFTVLLPLAVPPALA